MTTRSPIQRDHVNPVTRRLPPQRHLASACLDACRWPALVLIGSALSACSTLSDSLGSAKVDYRSTATATSPKLEVPPDLTQLSSDPRYAPPSGAPVSANALQTTAAAATSAGSGAKVEAPSAVAPQSVGELRIERTGNTRWLVTRLTPEQLWPLLREFWQQNGFTLQADRPEIGLMETDWAENRAKIPQDFVRRTIGKVFDGLYDTGERDKYRTRVERSSGGTEIYISHRGMVEVLIGDLKDRSRWDWRPSEPELEAEMLARLMLKLAPRDEVRSASQAAPAAAVQAAANAPAPAPKARILEGRSAATLQIDDGFDRTWRRVGLALDRGGFTLEDRDRNQGLYFVRYVDPKLAGKEDPNFFQRLFGAKKDELAGTRYRLKVSSQGSSSLLEVLDAEGRPRADDNSRAIVLLLLPELR